jgi:dihydrofolate reductase
MFMPPCISLIAALAENRVIGRKGRLPWHLPQDLRRFQALTRGHTVVMGRRTWDSIGQQPLKNRRNLVLSRNPKIVAPGCEVVPDLDTALAKAERDDEVFILGGADVYHKALPQADRLYLTVVHAAVEGEVLFPDFDLTDWQLIEEISFPADPEHAYAFTFRTYDRRDRRTK